MANKKSVRVPCQSRIRFAFAEKIKPLGLSQGRIPGGFAAFQSKNLLPSWINEVRAEKMMLKCQSFSAYIR
jgi:hypothetical protein